MEVNITPDDYLQIEAIFERWPVKGERYREGGISLSVVNGPEWYLENRKIQLLSDNLSHLGLFPLCVQLITEGNPYEREY
ncbi:hypothetical protein SedNR2807_10550 [Citrobacter sedlakii]